MITVHDLEVRAGARLLMEHVTFRVGPATRSGWSVATAPARPRSPASSPVRRCRRPAGRDAHRRGRLPAAGPAHQRPRGARAAPHPVRPRPRRRGAHGSARPSTRWPPTTPTCATRRCGSTSAPTPRCTPAAGTPPRPRPGRSRPASTSRTGSSTSRSRTLSGGQRRRVELARILFSGAETLLLDEPTNHLDADSIVWLREFLRSHKGGLVVISHDVGLLEACVNKVLHLDANRAEVDVYNMGWSAYLTQRETDERRRKRERANAERKAIDADGPGQQDARQGHQGAGRAVDDEARRAAAWPGSRPSARSDRVARITFPKPAPCGKTPLTAQRAVEVATARWRSSPTSTSPSTGAAGSSCSGSTAPARPPCCASSAASTTPTPGRVDPGHGAEARLLRPGARDPRHRRAPCWRTCVARRPQLTDTEARSVLGSFLFSGDDADEAGRRAVRRREDPARAGHRWSSRAPTCCCSTSRPTTSTRPRARRCWRAIRVVRRRDRARHPRRGRGDGAGARTGC